MTRASPSAAPVRFPSLDGLRAVSILFVIAHHLMGAAGTPASIGAVAHALALGTLGVRIFFVISGFLITSLLLGERTNTGAISLARFYVRRTMRIFPPFYAYVAAIALLELGGIIATNPGDYLHAVTYTMNYHNVSAGWYLGHAWSLSIEEQFYLLWPALLLAAGPRRAPWVLVGTTVIVPLIRAGATLELIPGFSDSGQSFATVADWLAGGALLALWRGTLHANARYSRLMAHPLTPLVLIAILFAGWTAFGHWRLSNVTSSVAMIAAVLLLDAVVTHPAKGIARALNTKTLMFIGRISYSLYLWQQLFCNRSASAWPSRFPVNVALTFACAILSYYLIEKPAHAAGRRLSNAI